MGHVAGATKRSTGEFADLLAGAGFAVPRVSVLSLAVAVIEPDQAALPE